MRPVSFSWLLACVPLLLPASAQSALILHLELNETSGASAGDASGNGLDGTLINMEDADWIAAQAGNGLSFDGVDEYIEILDDPLLDFGASDFTVSYWAFKRETSDNIFDNTYAVAKWGSGALPGTNEWLVNIGLAIPGTQTDRPHITVEVGNTSYSATSPDLITLNEWHHIVGVREGQELRIYMDGTLRAVDNSLPSGAVINDNGRDLRIAANSQPTNLPVWTDAIFDDIQIYSNALNDEQVAFLFENPGVVVPEPASAWLLAAGLVVLGLRRRQPSGIQPGWLSDPWRRCWPQLSA